MPTLPKVIPANDGSSGAPSRIRRRQRRRLQGQLLMAHLVARAQCLTLLSGGARLPWPLAFLWGDALREGAAAGGRC